MQYLRVLPQGPKRFYVFGLLAALGFALFLTKDSNEFAGRSYRIGVASFPPYLVAPNGGEPKGFAVDTIREAARRLDMRLEWVPVRISAFQTLTDGEADLYPMLAQVSGREGKVAISEPWWENGMVMISHQNAPIHKPADAKGKRIALIHHTFGLQRLEEAFPGAVGVPEKDYDAVLWHTCNGTTAGSLLDMRMAAVLALLPQCAGVDLVQHWVPEMNITYGVGGRLGMEREVAALRSRIVEMAQDGTLTRLGEPWGVQVPNQNRLLGMMVASGARGQLYGWIAVVLGLASLALVVLGFSLREARRRAEEALRLRSQFVANLSHEIRTPMHGVLGMTELLEQTKLDGLQSKYVTSIATAGQGLMRILNELLDFAKMESGNLVVETIAYSPADVAREAGRLFEASARQKGLEWSVKVDNAGPAWLMGDPSRVKQVLMNLLGNAVKFTETGAVRLKVKLSADGKRVRYSVRDDGVGLPKEHRSAIFEAFRQGDGSTSRKYGGTGLGLAISSGLVQSMGGEIGVNSELGRGSEFWFELPLAVTSMPEPEGRDRPMPTGEALQGIEGMRVLVAEDNPVNLRVLTAHLQKLGCAWWVAKNGEEAVAMAQQESFDAILMDGQMPCMDGFEATRLIRKLEGAQGNVPVIGVTACAFEEDRQRCLDSGMNAVVTKPYSVTDIRRELEKFAGANGGQRFSG